MLQSSRSLNIDGTLAGAETPESVIDSSREGAVKRGQKELQEKLGIKKQLSFIEKEQMTEHTSIDTARFSDITDYAESLASRIIQESVPKSVNMFDPTDLYAQDLASSILHQALETVDLYMKEKERSVFERTANSRLPAYNDGEEDDKKEKTKEVQGIYPFTPKHERADTSTDITEKPVDTSVLDKYKK